MTHDPAEQPATDQPPNPNTFGVHLHDFDDRRFCRICRLPEQAIYEAVAAAEAGAIPATTDVTAGAHLLPAARAVRLLLIPHIMRLSAAAAETNVPAQDGASRDERPQLPAAVCAEMWNRLAFAWGHLAALMELHEPDEFVAGDVYAGLELMYLNNPRATFAAGGGSLYAQLLGGLPAPLDWPPMLSVAIVPPPPAQVEGGRTVLEQQLATLTPGGVHVVRRGDYLQLAAELHLRVENLFRHRQRATALWAVLLQRTLAQLNNLPAIQASGGGYLKQVAPDSSLMQPISASEKAEHDAQAALFAYIADMLSKELATMHRVWLRVSRCEVGDLPRGPLESLEKIPGCILEDLDVEARAGLPGSGLCAALDQLAGLWFRYKAGSAVDFVRFRYVGTAIFVEVGDNPPTELTEETLPIYQASEYRALVPTFKAPREYRVTPWDRLAAPAKQDGEPLPAADAAALEGVAAPANPLRPILAVEESAFSVLDAAVVGVSDTPQEEKTP